MDSSTLMNLATMGVSGLAISKTIGKSSFTDTSSGLTAAAIIVIIIILVIWIMLIMAIYKLTDSGAHAILCLFFGSFYLTFALIYYGFNGYKFVKKM